MCEDAGNDGERPAPERDRVMQGQAIRRRHRAIAEGKNCL
jgi:hypothetical protein